MFGLGGNDALSLDEANGALPMSLIFGGAGVLLYLVAWIVIPEETEGASIAETFVSKRRS